MFSILFKAVRRTKDTTTALQTTVSSSGLLIAKLALSEAQLEALATTPVKIVTAPGANKLIVPLFIQVKLIIDTGYSSSPTFHLEYDGFTTNITASANPNWGTTGTKLSTQDAAAVNFVAGSDPRNTALMVTASADPTGAGVGTAVVTVPYYIANTV